MTDARAGLTPRRKPRVRFHRGEWFYVHPGSLGPFLVGPYPTAARAAWGLDDLDHAV